MQIGNALLVHHGTQRNAGVHGALGGVAVLVHAAVAKVAHGTGVHASLLLFQLGNQLHGADLGGARHGPRGEDGAKGVEARLVGPQDARHLRDEVLDVAKLFHLHEAVDADAVGVADAVDVVAGQVDEHDVLGAVLEGAAQLVGQALVLLGRLAALDGARNGVRDDAAVLALDQQLGRGANDLEILAVNVEEVRRRVDGAQVAVDVERVQVRRAGEALRRHALEDVALEDVLLELGDVRLVARLANVGLGLVAELDGALGRHRHLGRVEHVDELVNRLGGVAVRLRERAVGHGVGHLDVADDLDDAVEPVKGHNGVKQHEQRLGDLEHVLHRAGRPRLKVAHAVVANVSDGAARQRRQLQAGDVGDDMLAELPLEQREGIRLRAVAGPRGEDLARAGADEAVAAELLRGRRLEQERVLGRLGVRRDLEVRRRRRDEVGRDLSVYGDERGLQAGFLGRLADNVADGVERRDCRSLQKFGGADGQRDGLLELLDAADPLVDGGERARGRGGFNLLRRP